MKFLVVAVAVALLVWLLVGRPRKGVSNSSRRSPKPPAAEAMVACAHCGVHLPRGEALLAADGQPYCSAAHRVAGPREGGA